MEITLNYYTDPLCVWSWAYTPVWHSIRKGFEHINPATNYIMAGLMPSWKHFHDDTHLVSRPAQMGPMWMYAAHLTGMPVRYEIWAKNPPRSSFPACIAFICIAKQSVQAAEEYFQLLQLAVMTKGEDISDEKILTDLITLLPPDHNIDEQLFISDLHAKWSRDALQQQMTGTKQRRIERLPTVLIRQDPHPPVIITGYKPYPAVEEILLKHCPDWKNPGFEFSENIRSRLLQSEKEIKVSSKGISAVE